MTQWLPLVALLSNAVTGHESTSGQLPVCRNQVVAQVVKRVGCSPGDIKCWSRKGGFCGDHVEARIAAPGHAIKFQLASIPVEEIQPGDVAHFAIRAHYAYVERVKKDRAGRPVAVDLSEFNFGTCWVDPDLMVTDQYKVVNRRAGVPVGSVDGGFLRARRVSP